LESLANSVVSQGDAHLHPDFKKQPKTVEVRKLSLFSHKIDY